MNASRPNGIDQVVLDACKTFEEAMQDVANMNAGNALNSGFDVHASDNVPKTTNMGEMGCTSFANVLSPERVTRKVNFRTLGNENHTENRDTFFYQRLLWRGFEPL